MLDTKELERRILAMAVETFSADVILAVHCERGLDHVYEPVVWTRFVVAEGRMPLDAKVKLGFGLRLRLAFDDWGDAAYPVTFFYPESDYKRLYPAAA
ncbi:hypothetical protein GCM10011390_35820 [Aureimonas endophytica]|uniref:Uncharacterized protein n=1 Tax=Aureimonas endophytica TaxID=2027858 RepID=A0A916ZTK2_9HYPH|nr:hypothetical protein [Aureimonas endophytica]GGE13568.1 hypothetical protein GCM10011390_35820 [Aureimonas endophytica]